MERAEQLRLTIGRLAVQTSSTGGGYGATAVAVIPDMEEPAERWVYDPEGISPCLNVGHYAGVEPKIIEYDKDS